jgi:8-oxo-dGTP pyrophosphatase MutT (NUDIX family)
MNLDLLKSLEEALKKGEDSPFYVGVVLLNRTQDLILLGKRTEDGQWTGPGGGARVGENPRDAACREVFEETGIQISPSQLVDLPSMMARNNKAVHCYMVTDFSMAEPTPANDPDNEVKKWVWHSIEEKLPEPMTEGRKTSIVNAKLKLRGLLKSIVSNENIPGVDLNTAEYSMDAMAARGSAKLKMMEQMIENLNLGKFGSEPGSFNLGNQNQIHLSKVDEGTFSGWVKNADSEVVLKLEKMPIPSILQALEAKQLIDDSFAPTADLSADVEQIVEQHEKEWEGQEGTPAEQQADAAAFEQIEDLVRKEEPMEQLGSLLSALNGPREVHIHLHKAVNELEDALIKADDRPKDKGGFPIGTVRMHADGEKYRKISAGHWMRVVDPKQGEGSDKKAKEGEKASPVTNPTAPADKAGKAMKISKDELEISLTQGKFGMISSGRNPNSPKDKHMNSEELSKRHENLKKDLEYAGLHYVEMEGNYGEKEPSLLVLNGDKQRLQELGKKYNQDSVIYGNKGTQQMIYTTGENEGKAHYGEGFKETPDAKEYYSEIPLKGGKKMKFSLNFDFNSMKDAKD